MTLLERPSQQNQLVQRLARLSLRNGTTWPVRTGLKHKDTYIPMPVRVRVGVCAVALLIAFAALLAACRSTPQASERTDAAAASSVVAAQTSPTPALPRSTPTPPPSAPTRSVLTPVPAPAWATLTPTVPLLSPVLRAPPPPLLRPVSPPSIATTQAGATASSVAVAPVPSHRYLFPVQPAGIVSYRLCHHDYPASDIFVPIGTRFVAVTDGVVDFVSYKDEWDPKVNAGATRGGLSVAIIGDDGVRYYGSHLSHIAAGIVPGVQIQHGQLLGLSGKSGDARVTAPHVHFGISHPTRPDDWAARRGEINPYRYLNAWRKGLDVTPDLAKPDGGVC